MANLTVKIYDHEKRADGRWTFRPMDVNFDTRSTKLVPGRFKISWYDKGRKQFSKGHFRTLAGAIRAAKFQELKMKGAANGLEWQGSNPNDADRMPIDVASEAYLRTTKLNSRPGTYALAEYDLREWQQWNADHVKRTFVDQVTSDDMLEYRNWILGHRYDFTKDGVKAAKANRSPRTAVNKIMRVNHFICKTLKLQPGKGPIRQVDAEKIIVKKAANDVEYYSEEELEKFFAACTPEQNLLFLVFLKSGCRRDEIAYLYWDDIDFEGGTLHVCAKPEFDFTTKTKEERRVELPDDLIARLKEAQKSAKHRLVFPTKNGGPLGNSLLVACKRIGKRAGLNCGQCPTCVSKGECEHIYLHRFRATCGTRMLQRGVPVTDVQEHLGHNDLASTMRYLGNLKKKARRQIVNSVWGNVTAIPESVTGSVQ